MEDQSAGASVSVIFSMKEKVGALADALKIFKVKTFKKQFFFSTKVLPTFFYSFETITTIDRKMESICCVSSRARHLVLRTIMNF